MAEADAVVVWDGSMQPAKVKLIPALLQFVFLAVFPLAIVPVLLPLGVEVLLAEFADVRGWPVSLVLSLLVLVGTVFVSRLVLSWEGRVARGAGADGARRVTCLSLESRLRGGETSAPAEAGTPAQAR